MTFSLDNNQLYEAPLYFQINSTTGIVSIKQSLLNDKNLVENYKVIFIFLFIFAHHSFIAFKNDLQKCYIFDHIMLPYIIVLNVTCKTWLWLNKIYKYTLNNSKFLCLLTAED